MFQNLVNDNFYEMNITTVDVMLKKANPVKISMLILYSKGEYNFDHMKYDRTNRMPPLFILILI